MRLPNFLVIGAPAPPRCTIRSASIPRSSSARKEANFFLFDGPQQPPRGIAAADFAAMQRRSASTWAEYGALFAGATDAHRAIGEASPAYFVCPEVAARMRARFPAAKLVAILRQPVEQALSLHLVRQGGSASGAGLIEGFVAALAATARASRAGRAVSRSPSTGSITGISRRAVSSQPGRPRPRCPGRAAGTQDRPRA